MMRLSWNEIRVRAAAFAEDWCNASYEKGETQSFYNDFFQVFGVRRRTVARYEQHVAKLDNRSGYIDLFWPGELIVEQKSAGRNLADAYEQAGEYFDALPKHEQPRYILTSDFQTFELHDLSNRSKSSFALCDLPDHVEKFGFIVGVQRRIFRDQDPVNIEAAELVGRLHDALFECGYLGNDLEILLVRIVFCLFADDTGIFERDIFQDLIETHTQQDGSNTGACLLELFYVLNTPDGDRQSTLDEDLQRFPYVDGDLFNGAVGFPAFDARMREKLLDACNFNWSNISPAIFGALFQSVMNHEERRAQGAYYTTEKNILKVIELLFMDDLRAEFERLKVRRRGRLTALQQFQAKLGSLKFFDPACGCGNFLIIAYRELRLLEIDVLKEIFPGRNVDLAASELSLIDVDQFYGIEIGEFPARIAETALWMMDHIMNNRLSREFGQIYARIPLKKSPHIIHADALESDWESMVPAKDCSYIFGNPPFIGAKFQTDEQREQVRRIAAIGNGGGTLDYVSAWFIKAGDYIAKSNTRIGFVATNSITQGEQVAQLWQVLFERCKLEIAFAHRTFAWGSDARGQAHVHVVIIGLDRQKNAQTEKRLFDYPDINGEPEQSVHKILSPYLFGAESLADPYLVVQEESTPINGMRSLQFGTQPLENGHLKFSTTEKEEFTKSEPRSVHCFRPFIGASEFLYNEERWILHTDGLAVSELRRLPMVKARLQSVREFRSQSCREATKRLADFPSSYGVTVIPEKAFLLIPRVSSERREYIPIGWLEPPTIPSEATLILEDASLPDFALLTSAMHMVWLRYIGGRLKSDYRYSIGLVYNTFPLPPGLDLTKLEPLAQAVLDARASHPNATLADLYDSDLMPKNLRRAHNALDHAVDRQYKRSKFNSERERVEHLFSLYEKMRLPLISRSKQKKKR
ncbi:MAG: N-6 DNA methylase [Gammaproteobacteria bacterium]|nr:N-6 DNA methylase [Gammaproteobacteria bacterium]MCY4274894.1 N-6 DNA methylase [Gammaproteobacteria bacterium]